MLHGMNSGHSSLSAWGMACFPLKDHAHILDIGCGGGANIAKMLKDLPNSMVDGIDYSNESVAFSKNKRRCTRETVHNSTGRCLTFALPKSVFGYCNRFWNNLFLAIAGKRFCRNKADVETRRKLFYLLWIRWHKRFHMDKSHWRHDGLWRRRYKEASSKQGFVKFNWLEMKKVGFV